MIEPDPDPTGWLSIEAAAAAYGTSSRTIRRRILAGTLAARRVTTGHGEAYRVPPPPAAPPPPPDPAKVAVDRLDALGRAFTRLDGLPAAVEQLRADVGQMRTDLAALASLAAEVDQLRGRLAEREQEIEQLREALNTAQSQKRRLWGG